MESEYNAVLGNERVDIRPDLSDISEFDAEIVYGEGAHWVWRIEEL